MNDSMAKLSDSLSQYAATALINLQLPSFAGLPDQDINTFIKEFKSATMTLTEELRCLALNRALIGPAHIWAKTNIKDEIKQGNWSGARAKLRERFLPPGQVLRHLEKLSKMKYDPRETTLSSYVDVFADLYKKAYYNAADSDVIRGLRLNLTPEILRHLNTLSATWTELKSLSEFMTIIQRIERDILPYEAKPKSDDNSTILELTRAIKELRESVAAKKQTETNLSHEPVEVVAAISRQGQGRTRNRGQEDTKRARYDGNVNRNRERSGNERDEAREPRNNERNQHDGRISRSELQRQYESQHGKPPGPCWTCGENHYNRHCPFTALN